MNNCFLRIFTFLIVSVTTFSLESIEKDFEINIPFYEDSRNWSRGQFGEDQLVRCAEYFLDGEVRENWSELVTTQYFVSRFDFSLDDFFRKVIRELAKTYPRNRIDSRIIKSSKESLLAEWWIKEKTLNDQHEWVRIIRKEGRIGIVRYTIKNVANASTKARIWLNILSKVSLDPKISEEPKLSDQNPLNKTEEKFEGLKN